jgi:cytochrome P450
LQYAEKIINQLRKEQRDGNFEEEKPKTFIRALMSKKHNFTDEEISDEIKTMLVAVRLEIYLGYSKF